MSGRGRPRAFDRATALRSAMEVFWERGYEGTSVGDLCATMGINKPSLYAAFGCKEALFREAVTLYDEIEGAEPQRLLRETPTAAAAIESMLRAHADAFTDPEKPSGCMVVLAATIGAPEHAEVRRWLAENRMGGQIAFRRRIERGISDGDLSADHDPDRLAGFFTTVLEGLAIQAKDGAAREVLHGIIACAMLVLSPADERGL